MSEIIQMLLKEMRDPTKVTEKALSISDFSEDLLRSIVYLNSADSFEIEEDEIIDTCKGGNIHRIVFSYLPPWEGIKIPAEQYQYYQFTYSNYAEEHCEPNLDSLIEVVKIKIETFKFVEKK